MVSLPSGCEPFDVEGRLEKSPPTMIGMVSDGDWGLNDGPLSTFSVAVRENEVLK
jgi:hypothetical protein